MQSTARENVNIPAYGNVEHQGTAIVSEISIKWAPDSSFCREGGRASSLPAGMLVGCRLEHFRRV
jgi:hypothetical protein